MDWEFVANTLKSSAASVALGSPVTFSIAPESGDAAFTLTASIGDISTAIVEKSAATSHAWTPPLSLASEIPTATSGTVTVGMVVYDSAGNEKRREVLYQTVTVPTDAVRPTASAIQTTLSGGFNGGILTGETSISVIPIGATGDDYGADIANMTVVCYNGSKVMTMTWTAAEMTEEPSKFTGVAKTIPKSFCATTDGLTLTLTVIDTRGITASISKTLTVYAYSRPVINAFSVDRYGPVYDANEQISGYQRDDVGDHVWVNASAQIADVAGLNMLAWRVDGSNGTSATGASGTSVIMTENMALFPDAVGADQNVQYTLTVTDSVGNTAQTYSEVVPGRANFSLAGSKYGVGVGCIARGTAQSPLFEVGYPSQFYDAIHTQGVYGADGGRLDGIMTYTFTAADFAPNFAPTDNNPFALRVYRSGKMIVLSGSFKVAASPSSSGQQMAVTLPDWAKPLIASDTIQWADTGCFWRARLHPDGHLYARYYSAPGTPAVFPAGVSLGVMLTWPAGDAFTMEPNLLLDSGRRVENNAYNVATYMPSAPLVPGETYTLSLCATPAAGVRNIWAHVSIGYMLLVEFIPESTQKQVFTATFTMPEYAPGHTPEDSAENAKIYIFRAPDDSTVTGNSIIHWIKVEKGARATNWTPAPEDFA